MKKYADKQIHDYNKNENFFISYNFRVMLNTMLLLIVFIFTIKKFKNINYYVFTFNLSH
jgi:hypothetical protein